MDRIKRPALALGLLFCVFGLLQLIFGIADLLLRAGNSPAFILSGVLMLAMGGGLTAAFWHAALTAEHMGPKSGFILATACWIFLPLFTALPFYFSNLELSYTDALFETVSGLTTTGSTVISGLDELDPLLLLWRSVLQWVGGVGIILMAVTMMPFLKVGGMQLFQIESSGLNDSFGVRPGVLLGAIGWSYVVLTVLCAGAYAIAGMSLFDAVNHAMTTLSTGGYSTHDASMGYFTEHSIQWIATIFMIAGALPFLVYVKSVSGRPFAFADDPQAPLFVALLAATWLAMAALLAPSAADYPDALRRVAFNVTSVVTTTGYASEDYQLWGPGFIGLFFALTFVGGCAGSTAGGVKIYRFQLLRIFSIEHLRRLISPSLVQVHTYGEATLTRDVAFSVLAFLALFVGSYSAGAVALTLTGLDLTTALSASATALCNVGPGFGDIIGPAGNFAPLPDSAKWILSALMLLGRLELFALLVMFDPFFWR